MSRYLLPTPDPETESYLADLHRRDYEAVLRGDRLTMIIARLSWGEAFLGAYGSNPAALPRLTDASLQLLPESAERSPVWREILRARPLVMVTKRQVYSVAYGYKSKAKWYREVLACGHTVELPADLFGAEPPARRRCRECGEQQRALEVAGA